LIVNRAEQTDYIDNDALREALGLADHVLAVNAGSNGPLCQAAWNAIEETYLIDRRPGSPETPGYIELYDELTGRDRREVARLLNCEPDAIAMCESTTVGMNILLWGLDFAPGDEILTTSLENIAALVPLRVLAQRTGAELRTLELGYGEIDVSAAFEQQVTAKTRLVLASDVNYATGARLDLTGLCTVAHEHNVLLFADGVQAAGTCPIDVRASGVDGYAIARHKFLCGPASAGALYV